MDEYAGLETESAIDAAYDAVFEESNRTPPVLSDQDVYGPSTEEYFVDQDEINQMDNVVYKPNIPFLNDEISDPNLSGSDEQNVYGLEKSEVETSPPDTKEINNNLIEEKEVVGPPIQENPLERQAIRKRQLGKSAKIQI